MVPKLDTRDYVAHWQPVYFTVNWPAPAVRHNLDGDPTVFKAHLAEEGSDQSYYWTDAWQREEATALEELARGEFVEFVSVADALAWLNEPE
jgi:hypothetical protein